jgi:hypothetical protein
MSDEKNETPEQLAEEFAEYHSIVPEFPDTTNNSILCAALLDKQLLAAAYLEGYRTGELKGARRMAEFVTILDKDSPSASEESEIKSLMELYERNNER